MALSKTITTSHGLEIPNAYIRVDRLGGNKNNLDIKVSVYVSDQTQNEGYPWVEQYTYSFAPSVETGAENFVKQAYLYLKTLPEFSDAVDI